MQVLGDLIRLPNDGCSLPLPWWQRAPLGLLDRTSVHVGLVQSTRRPVGDVVVSVLDINKWDNMVRLECSHPDQSGVLAGLMEAVLPLNIALAEAVTTETGEEHHATLFCEDKGTQKVKDAIPRIKGELTKRGFRAFKLDPYLSPVRLPILKSCRVAVEHGWLQGIPFQSWIQEHSDQSRDKIDLTQAVVSADTDNRLLRFVFPFRGAKTIAVRHRDIPGALRSIFNEFMACQLNVLSALLRRGGQKENYAELIAVCEPSDTRDSQASYDHLRERIRKIDQQFDAAPTFSDAKPADEVIYVRPRNRKRPLLFAARHLNGNSHQTALDGQVRQTLKDSRWHVLDAPSLATHEGDTAADTYSLMERADAAVVLITGFQQSVSEDFKLHVMHELGYLRALAKPTLVLTEPGQSAVFSNWVRTGPSKCAEVVYNQASPPLPDVEAMSHLVGNWSREARFR